MPKLIRLFKFSNKPVYKLVPLVVISLLTIQCVSNLNFVSSAYAQERVYTYSSKIKVLSNRSLDVTETITVYVENKKIRHGIFRDFETSRINQNNKKVDVKITIIDVKRNGVREQYHTRKQGDKIRVFFGSKTKLVSKGIQTYIIRYVTDNQLNAYTNKDEFYWNASGNKWSMPIFRVEATIILPSRVKRKTITFNAYSGYNGVNKQDYVSSFTNNHTIKFALNRKYMSGNGLTIAVAWPTGFIDAPKPTSILSLIKSGITEKPAIIEKPEKIEVTATPVTPEIPETKSTIAAIVPIKEVTIEPKKLPLMEQEPSIPEIKKEPQKKQLLTNIKDAVSQLKLKQTKPEPKKTVRNSLLDFISNSFSTFINKFSTLSISNLIGLAGLLILLIYYFIIRLYLNSNKSTTYSNSKENIPDNLSPASIRYIYEMGYDDRTFGIALINIAVKGHIDIVNTGKSYKIERRDSSTAEDLSNDESILLNTLMKNKSVILLTPENHKVIRDAMTKHQKLLEVAHKSKYFTTNGKWFNYGVALLAVTALGMSYSNNPIHILLIFCLLSLFASSTYFLSYIFLDILNFYKTFKLSFFTNSKLYKSIQETKQAYIFAIFAIESGLFIALMNYIDTVNVITVGLAGFTCAIFSNYLFSPNAEGENIINKIVNLKESITHGEMLQVDAEYDSIQISQQISAFDNYLPYTIALGVESEWGDHYSLLFDNINDDNEEILGYSPHWYHGSGWQENNTTDFCESLSSNFSLSAASAAHSPEYNYNTNQNTTKH